MLFHLLSDLIGFFFVGFNSIIWLLLVMNVLSTRYDCFSLAAVIFVLAIMIKVYLETYCLLLQIIIFLKILSKR